MKDFLHKASRRLSILFVSVCLLNAHSAKAGAMSGIYSIGSSGTYTSFSSAVSDLTSNGISGAVTFKVAAGTYNEQVVIGNITGTSATNTITFQGQNDSSQVVLTYASSSSSSSNYTLELNASRYVTFKKMSIIRSGTATYSTVVYLLGTYKCQFQNSLLTTKLDPDAASSITPGSPVIYSAGIDTGTVINGNRIQHGFNGICLTAAGYANVISNNIIDTCGLAGLYVTGLYQVNLLVMGNTFNAGTVTVGSSSSTLAYGIRFDPTAAKSFSIIKNKFYATSTSASTCRCLVIFTAGVNNGVRNLIANNFFWVSAGSSASTGITLGGGTNIDIDYNNVLMTSTPTTPGAALYIYSSSSYPGSGNTLRNNNLVNQGGGYCIDNENDSASTGYTVGLAIEDYNNLYTTGSYTAYYRNSKYAALSDYQSACKGGGAESHSISAYPGYKSTSAPFYDLHESSGAVYQTGTPISNVTDDIDGNKRSTTTPNIGACEFTPVLIDAGVTVTDSPTTFCVSATKDIVIQFSNFGLHTITSATIGWSVNGKAQTSYSWTGSLASSQTSAQINLGSFAFTSKSPYIIKVWTTSPNASSDQNNSNDTLTKTVQSGLSGTYYLGGASPDFTSFNGALGAIGAYGVCGPTVIRVRNGTYTEQLTVTNIPSMSSTNTVTFQSDAGDSSKVILTQATSSTSAVGIYGNNVTIQLNAAQWFTFKGITIQKTGTLGNDNVVQIFNSAHNNSFQNCRFIGLQNIASTTADIIYSDSVSTTTETGNTFMNNAFKYGYSAIDFVGQAASRGTGTIISGNRIDSTYGPGISLSNEDAAVVSGNMITNVIGGASYAGIQLTHCNGAISVSQNKILLPYGAYAGIYLLYSQGASATPGSIVNNYVSINSTAKPRGIFDSASAHLNIYYNTVDLYGKNSGACIYANASSGNINVNDNMLDNSTGYDIVVPTGSSIASSNYNDFYTSGTNMGSVGGKAATSLAGWVALTTMDSNSVSLNPKFFSDTSFNPLNTNIYGLGDTISGITTDINDSMRNPSGPSIGCVNIPFYAAANDAGISGIVSPANGASICAGKYPITVFLKNFGSAILDTATINWTLNGNAQTSYTYTGAIAPGTAATVTIDTMDFTAGTMALKVWSTNPNNITDSTAGNDTSNASFTVNPLPTASIITDSAVCSGNATSLGGAAVSGSVYSWTSKPAGFSSTDANPSINPTSAAKYYQTETNIFGCMKTDSVSITIRGFNPVSPTVGNAATICSGNSIQVFGKSTIGGISYMWSSSPSGFSSTDSTPYVTPTTTTIYNLAAVNKITGCVSVPSGVTITVNALPAANAGSSAAICSGGSATIGGNAVAGDNYSWTSIPSGFSITDSGANVTPTTSTVYYLTETNPATGCSNTNSVLITVNPIPAAFVGSSASVCSGSPTTTIGGTSVKGNSYSWSPNTYLSSGTVSNPTVTLGATTTYTLTETINSTGCTRSRNVTLTLNQSPAANAGVSQAMCFGSSVKLGGGSVSGSTYSWSPSSSLNSASSSSPTASPASTTAYAMTETVSATGCKTTNVITLTVNQLPAAYASAVSSTSVCAGQPYSLGGTPVSGEQYSWTSSPLGFTSSLANPNATPSKQTTYTLTETNPATGCSASNSVSVGLIALPVANLSTAATCAGSTGIVVANNTTASEKFNWYYNGNVLSSQTGFKVIASNGGVYQTNITDTITGCSNMSNVATLVVNPLPSTLLKMLKATTQCDGDSVSMIAPLVSDDLYQWSKDGDTIAGAHNYIYAAKTTGVYQLMVTSSATKCSDTSLSVPVTINPIPTVPFNVPGKTTICDGQGVLMSTSKQTGVTYSWMRNGVALAGTDSNYFSATSTGIYDAKLTFDATGCSNTTSTVAITVNEVPQTNVSALGNKNLCPGASVLLAVDANPSNTYRWENSNGYIAGASSDTFTTFVADNYAVTVTDNQGCSATSNPVAVTAALYPKVSVNRPSATTVCQTTIILSAKDSGIASMQWWKDGAAISGATGDSLTVNQTGLYTVMVKGAVTCTAMDTIGITENAMPFAAFAVSNDSVCFGKGIDFINQSTISSGNIIYSWAFGDGDSSTDVNPAYIYTKAGNYNVKFKASAPTGCNASASETVTVLPVTKSTFSVSPVGGRRLELKATDSTAGATYVWNYGDSSFSIGINGYHEYNRDGKFSITLTAINANGCVTSTTTSELVILSGFGQMTSDNITINVFPNPFKTQTNVRYNLNEGSMVQMDVFDINGRVVAHVDNNMQSAGEHNFVFNGPNPGVYFVKMIVGGQLFVNRIVQQ